MEENDKQKDQAVASADSPPNGKDRNAPGAGESVPEEGLELMGKVEEQAAEEQPAQESEMDALRREKDDLYNRLLRKQADFENFRKRTEKEKREFLTYALSEFVLELLAILDNFERALAHADDATGAEYRRGVELIYRQFRDLMEKKGLRAIETTGQTFDPNFHEAILREERNDLPENTILSEMQKGYYFREKLLRPALVKVSFRTEQEEEEPEIEIID